jgi:hypothetical protein
LHSPNVLVVGIDPRAVPGMDADTIEAALEQERPSSRNEELRRISAWSVSTGPPRRRSWII